MTTPKRLWVAEAPAGIWSSGPNVIFDLAGLDAAENIARYQEMGWRVSGPYELAGNSVDQPDKN